MDNYQFPDEQNNPDADAPEFDIEVEDDTPEVDRGRTPMPKALADELDSEDLDKYDATVKEKLKQMRKVWHDERREKESALREHQAALQFASQVVEENRRLKGVVQAGETEYVAATSTAAEMAYEKAKAAYKEAYDMGDSDALIAAQEELNQRSMQLNYLKNVRIPALQQQVNDVQHAPEPAYQAPDIPRPDTKALSWQEHNPWFGSHKSMTAYALGVHEDLKDAGVEIGSEEYYAALDKTMRERFPDVVQGGRGRNSTVVASASRSTGPQKVRLKQSQMALIKKLGITPEQYVREFIKENRNG